MVIAALDAFSFETLVSEHDALEVMAETLLRLVDAGDLDAALAQRTIFAAAINTHLMRDAVEVHPMLVACNDGATSMAAADFCAQFVKLEADWETYLDAWDHARAHADRTAFSCATHAIVEQLRARIDVENTRLYPIALRAAVLRLRA
ncbi:MAG: hemerythrin domain-containing protein [Sphingomonadaceae bacterium]